MLIYKNENVTIEQISNIIKVKTKYQENVYTNILTSTLTKGYFILFLTSGIIHEKSIVLLKTGIIIDNFDVLIDKYVKDNILIAYKYRTQYFINLETGKVYSINEGLFDIDLKTKTFIIKEYYKNNVHIIDMQRDMHQMHDANNIYLINNNLCVLEYKKDNTNIYTNIKKEIILETTKKIYNSLNYTIFKSRNNYMHITGENVTKKVNNYLQNDLFKGKKYVYSYYFKPVLVLNDYRNKFCQSKIVLHNDDAISHLQISI